MYAEAIVNDTSWDDLDKGHAGFDRAPLFQHEHPALGKHNVGVLYIQAQILDEANFLWDATKQYEDMGNFWP